MLTLETTGKSSSIVYLYQISIVLIIALSVSSFASSPKSAIPKKASTSDYTASFDGNQIVCYSSNEGFAVNYRVTGKSGLYWPTLKPTPVVFTAGPWLIGKVNGTIRSACVEYTTEFLPGKVNYNPASPSMPGTPDDPTNPVYRIYKINRGDSPNPASPNYNPDYATWPAGDGAPAHDGELFDDLNRNGIWDSGEPFEDFNGNGTYDGPDGQLNTGQDPPHFLGDQQLWYIMNDFDSPKHGHLFSTNPLGIEIQVTQYGFKAQELENVMFVRWLIINKSGQRIEGAYFGLWADPDLGKSIDDLAGCDTTLDLGYVYNGDDYDEDNFGIWPPAVGFTLLQGPIQPAPGRQAITSSGFLQDYRNLPMTALLGFSCGGSPFCSPETAVEAYRCLQGLTLDGNPIFDQNHKPTTFTFPGDPVTGTGWVAEQSSKGDHYLLLSSGPFDLPSWTDVNGDGRPQTGEPGMQEVCAAICIAPGPDRLQAIATLRDLVRLTRAHYRYGNQRPELLITSPSTGSKLTTPINITWTNDVTQPLAEIVVPCYSLDGQTWVPIDTLLTNSGSYTWNAIQIGDAASLFLRLWGFAATADVAPNPPVTNGIINLLNCNFSHPVGPLIIDNPGINDPPYVAPLRQSYIYQVPVSGDFHLHWQVVDPENNKLSVNLELKNRYQDWHAIALNLPSETEWTFSSYKFPNSLETLLRLKVSDGTNQVIQEIPHQFVLRNIRSRLLALTHSAGGSNATIEVRVVNLEELNRHRYSITFQTTPVKTYSVFDQGLQNYVLRDLPLPPKEEESPVFDGIALAFNDWGENISFVPENSGWISGSCNWTYSLTPHLGRSYPACYEVRFTNSGSRDINGQWVPLEVWNVTEQRQSDFVLGTASATSYNLGIYENYEGAQQVVWGMSLAAPPTGGIAPQVGDVVYFFVTVPLSSNDVYEFTNEFVSIAANGSLPQKFELLPVYPNPFNPLTTIRYRLPHSASVEISVYNLLGQVLTRFQEGEKPAGEHTIIWDAGSLPSGIYFIALQTGRTRQVQKCVLLK